MRKGFWVMFLGLVALSVPMFGAISIDFGTGGTGSTGLITVFADGHVTGSGISLGTMTVNGVSVSANGAYDTYGAGANQIGGTDGSAVLDFDTSTGAFHIVGGVCDKGFTTCSDTSNDLVSSNADTTVLVNGLGASASIITAISTGTLVFTEPDAKSTALEIALGISTSTQWNLMNASINGLTSTTCPQGDASTDSCFTTSSSDINNASTPEPTSVLLFGTVLFGVTNLIRRRARKA